jgi:hypothetical protein
VNLILTRLSKQSLVVIAVLCAATVAQAAAVPVREAAVNGVWAIAKPMGNKLLATDGKAPPLNAEGKKLYAERTALLAKGDKSFDLSQKCKPIGFPRGLWDGGPFDIQVQPSLVFMGFTWNRNHRMVNFSNDPPNLQVPRYYGTGSASWDGNTLLIDSGLYNTNSVLDNSGLPFSEEMALEERYTPLNGGKNLQVKLTITDSAYYSKPWTATLRFNRVLNGRIQEDVCQLRSDFYKDLVKGR